VCDIAVYDGYVRVHVLSGNNGSKPFVFEGEKRMRAMGGLI
jgi:hypothetical protein